MTQEVNQWRAFNHPDGSVRDLSFLDAHQVVYVQRQEGKADLEYKFWVTYSFHCFTKDYAHQSAEVKEALMYHAARDSRPFCEKRYVLAQAHLRAAILSLGESKVIHGGYESYAVVEVNTGEDEVEHYFISFKVFREKKKLRLHVQSAYPVSERPNGRAVKFFAIAFNLLRGRPLPKPPK
ncbi:stationary phase growth adaptation protein (plasmid) [Raoultella ornithinolytica]|uniref:stationary phase growth adaptation protein n=1 Tax=Raoultella ornithinolytica TaxID=54291 RepID=UPI00292A6F84|nr:stationary phase growth adaptation protein [Raoultella ornithinolytica]MDV1094978.1 stationary phase growth adaptation protein [Raoultella ornithinolytica]MDV1122678.1 stationary phase growth adaptation protein [Raoultella ornithinolytica]MDV1893193.1 stationary phase growth adaptation protein [Raoultella ornithinolytica]